jgi:hypothetical protein
MLEQEAKRREPWQQRPEFKQWLAGMERGLERFFTELVPDMPSDPYTVDGLRHAEAAALAYFPDAEAASADRTPANAETIDGFRRYLGQVYLTRLEGRWIWLDLTDEGDFLPIVQLPAWPGDRNVDRVLVDAMHARTGNEFTQTFEADAREHDEWQQAGRPNFAEWIPLRRQLRRDRRGR